MKRVIQCNSCEGSKVDKDGNRCIDCSGVGSFPHWKDRQPEVIERNISALNLCLAEAEKELLSAKRRHDGGQIALWEHHVEYWSFHIKEMKCELAYARQDKKESSDVGENG